MNYQSYYDRSEPEVTNLADTSIGYDMDQSYNEHGSLSEHGHGYNDYVEDEVVPQEDVPLSGVTELNISNQSTSHMSHQNTMEFHSDKYQFSLSYIMQMICIVFAILTIHQYLNETYHQGTGINSSSYLKYTVVVGLLGFLLYTIEL